MTGLVVLGVLLIYIAVAAGVTVAAKGRWKLLVVAVFILIPTWDILPGKIALARHCEQEGGIKIYRSVDGVEGFLSLDGRVYEESFRRDGYKYVEVAREKRDPRTGNATGIEYSRVTLGEDGKLREEKIEKPISRYAERLMGNYDIISWLGIAGFVDLIVDLRTDEKIGEYREIGWRGNWIQRLASPIMGGGGSCRESGNPYERLRLQVLRPAKTSS